jgi:hypothetical protein
MNTVHRDAEPTRTQQHPCEQGEVTAAPRHADLAKVPSTAVPAAPASHANFSHRCLPFYGTTATSPAAVSGDRATASRPHRKIHLCSCRALAAIKANRTDSAIRALAL